MIKRTEGYFDGNLFYQSWTQSGPSPKPRATLVLTHGIAEHSEAYHETALELVPRGWDIYAMDLRGHGRSEGRRGYIEDFQHFSRDLDLFVRHLRAGVLKNSGVPMVMMGHSMGGLITLRYLVDQGEATPAVAAVLSSPALGISMPVPALKEAAAKLLLKVLPQITLPNDIPYDKLTHIEERWKTYPGDPLRHDKISPPMYFGMLEGFQKVKEGAGRIKLPTLVVAAGEDHIVSRPAIEEFFPLIGSERKKLIIYEKSYHEIMNDVERSQVFSDIDAFLSLVVGGTK